MKRLFIETNMLLKIKKETGEYKNIITRYLMEKMTCERGDNRVQ